MGAKVSLRDLGRDRMPTTAEFWEAHDSQAAHRSIAPGLLSDVPEDVAVGPWDGEIEAAES